MLRVSRRRDDGTFEVDERLSRLARPSAAAPSSEAVAAGEALRQGIADIAARNRALVDSLTDDALRRSVIQGLRGR